MWLRYLAVQNNLNLTFHWVKGHAGHPENERCDELAVAAACSNNLAEDTGYKPAGEDGLF